MKKTAEVRPSANGKLIYFQFKEMYFLNFLISTHFRIMAPVCTLWKNLKTSGFMMFSGGIEKKQEISIILCAEVGVSSPFSLNGIDNINITVPSNLIGNRDLSIIQWDCILLNSKIKDYYISFIFSSKQRRMKKKQKKQMNHSRVKLMTLSLNIWQA